MAKRRNNRGQARREPATSSHGILWFSAGLVCGLALATYAWFSGLLPPQQQDLTTLEQSDTEPPNGEVAPANDQRQYDFYTVLPEMEVVVPEQEITRRSTNNNATPARNGPYYLQVGSFRSASDADSQKAKLALLGLVANVQAVTVNGQTWHRVRLGPIDSARETDGMRRRLEDNGLEAIVLRDQ